MFSQISLCDVVHEYFCEKLNFFIMSKQAESRIISNELNLVVHWPLLDFPFPKNKMQKYLKGLIL